MTDRHLLSAPKALRVVSVWCDHDRVPLSVTSGRWSIRLSLAACLWI